MKITIKTLKFLNFKGIRNLTIELNGNLDVRGKNASFKTTIMDGFIWLFFSRDSNGSADFNIKTLDENGNAIPKLDHEVECTLDIDGSESTFKRVYREKWTKKRGEEFPEMSGHETLYFVNDVPLSQSEYNGKVNAIIDEGLFKLLTNPLYFNSLKWDARRAILFKLAGEVTDNEIASQKPEFASLLSSLSNKSLEEYKRELASKKLKLKHSIDEIPSRVDEANRNMPEQPDIEAINREISGLQLHIAEINEIIEDYSTEYNKANEANLEVRRKIVDNKNLIISKESEYRTAGIQSGNESQETKLKLTGEVQILQRKINNLQNPIQDKQNYILALEKELTALRADWTKISTEKMPVFEDLEDAICPTCKRPLEQDSEAETDKLKESWAKVKVDKLNTINESGKSKTELIASQKAEIVTMTADMDKLLAEIKEKEKQRGAILDTVQVDFSFTDEQSQEIEKLNKNNQLLESQIIQVEKVDNSKRIQQRSEYHSRMDQERAKLAVQGTIETTKARIAELLESEKSYAKQIAELEKMQFTVTNFEKAKVDMIEKKVNDKFEFVTFRMFKELINGGMEPCCDTLYKGVPFPDLNSAAKIWAGLDIIRTLSDYNHVYAPCWLDNREGCTDIPETKSQVINLYVDPKFKELTFN